jgi:hypothetical protein
VVGILENASVVKFGANISAKRIKLRNSIDARSMIWKYSMLFY